jgi:hypothetical protein
MVDQRIREVGYDVAAVRYVFRAPLSIVIRRGYGDRRNNWRTKKRVEAFQTITLGQFEPRGTILQVDGYSPYVYQRGLSS